MSNRQLIILMTTILDISLNPEFLSATDFARLLSAISGKKQDGIRQTIIELRKNGFNTKQGRHDMQHIATLLEKIKPNMAQKLKNMAQEGE